MQVKKQQLELDVEQQTSSKLVKEYVKAVFNFYTEFSSVSSVTQSCPTLCNPMNRSTPGLLVHRQLLEFTETRIH